MRCMAPAAFWTSPQTSPRAPTPLAAITDRKTNWIRSPGVMPPVSTEWAARHRTKATPPKIRPMTMTVIRARARMRLAAARKATSTESPKRRSAVRSRPKAWTVSSASRLSPAKPTASANRSWAVVDSVRTRRPKMNSGAMTTGASAMTARVRTGETVNITIVAPIVDSMLRSATEAEVPTRVSIRVTSVVRRDSTSPVRVLRK